MLDAHVKWGNSDTVFELYNDLVGFGAAESLGPFVFQIHASERLLIGKAQIRLFLSTVEAFPMTQQPISSELYIES